MKFGRAATTWRILMTLERWRPVEADHRLYAVSIIAEVQLVPMCEGKRPVEREIPPLQRAPQAHGELGVLAQEGVDIVVEVPVVVQDPLDPHSGPAASVEVVDGQELRVRLRSDPGADHLAALCVSVDLVGVRVEDRYWPRRIVGRLLQRVRELRVETNPRRYPEGLLQPEHV